MSQLAIPSFQGFNGAVNDKGQLTGVRKFMAAKLGVAIPKGTTAKEAKVLFLAATNKDELKKLSKEYDSQRNTYYRQVNQINGALAADPSFRKTLKIWKNKAGDTCANVAYRPERKLSMSAQLRADNAEAKVRELEAKLAAVLALQS